VEQILHCLNESLSLKIRHIFSCLKNIKFLHSILYLLNYGGRSPPMTPHEKGKKEKGEKAIIFYLVNAY
jgi:hypothetical protein